MCVWLDLGSFTFFVYFFKLYVARMCCFKMRKTQASFIFKKENQFRSAFHICPIQLLHLTIGAGDVTTDRNM